MNEIEWSGSNPFKGKCPVCGSSFLKKYKSKQKTCSQFCGQKVSGKAIKQKWDVLEDNYIIGRLQIRGLNESQITKDCITLNKSLITLNRTINEKQRALNNS